MDVARLRQEVDALREAEWTSWPHAYGGARDTPGHLAALLGDDQQAQEDAAHHFLSAVVHQYTVWPASPDAFEWLIRVLRVKTLPPHVLWDCLDALAEAAKDRDLPAVTRVPELSGDARAFLARFGETSDDDLGGLWAEFIEADVFPEVYDWVLARMAAMRPAVAELVAELEDRVPEACADLRAAWAG